MRLATIALTSFLALAPLHAAAEVRSLRLDEALALARERAPALAAASARIDEARGRLVEASVLLRENPRVEAGAGHRSSEGERLAAQAGVSQAFELGGQRGARIEAAEAGLARASAARDDSTRRVLRGVAAAFYRCLHAEEDVRMARGAEAIAGEVARIAERRYRADDVPVLDVNLGRAALSRSRADLRSAEAGRAAALGELATRLDTGPDERLSVEGDLRVRPRFELGALLQHAGERADLRALDAAIAEAAGELQLARGRAWPELALGASYERDEGDDVVLGTVGFTLPAFARGRGLAASATARAGRLRIELDAARRAAQIEVRAAFELWQRRVQAVEELEQNALPLLDENDSLAQRSYDVGQIGLAELLVVRRETLDTRREYLDRLLDAALAGVELEASAGLLP
jgi:cobalt-zinc-cadmium efflux system outer membrane protein